MHKVVMSMGFSDLPLGDATKYHRNVSVPLHLLSFMLKFKSRGKEGVQDFTRKMKITYRISKNKHSLSAHVGALGMKIKISDGVIFVNGQEYAHIIPLYFSFKSDTSKVGVPTYFADKSTQCDGVFIYDYYKEFMYYASMNHERGKSLYVKYLILALLNDLSILEVSTNGVQ